MENRAHQAEALDGAASFFEAQATGSNPAPLAFAQAIRSASTDSEALYALRVLVAAVFFPSTRGVPTLAEAATLAANVLSESDK